MQRLLTPLSRLETVERSNATTKLRTLLTKRRIQLPQRTRHNKIRQNLLTKLVVKIARLNKIPPVLFQRQIPPTLVLSLTAQVLKILLVRTRQQATLLNLVYSQIVRRLLFYLIIQLTKHCYHRIKRIQVVTKVLQSIKLRM